LKKYTVLIFEKYKKIKILKLKIRKGKRIFKVE